MAREAHAEQARRKISVEEKQPSSFPSHPGPKAVQSFLAKSRIWGFTQLKKSIFLVRYMNRKMDESIETISILISKKESISFNV